MSAQGETSFRKITCHRNISVFIYHWVTIVYLFTVVQKFPVNVTVHLWISTYRGNRIACLSLSDRLHNMKMSVMYGIVAVRGFHYI